MNLAEIPNECFDAPPEAPDAALEAFYMLQSCPDEFIAQLDADQTDRIVRAVAKAFCRLEQRITRSREAAWGDIDPVLTKVMNEIADRLGES